MRAKYKELLDKSTAAMIAAIEIYNKPDFQYRGETFSILAINSWELLLKAKYLKDNNNNIRSLYVKEQRKNKDGSKSKAVHIKTTRSGNPFTHSLDFIGKKLINSGELNAVVFDNINALIELRDSAIHFYNYSLKFNTRIQEIGTATLKNYVILYKKWFDKDLSEYNFYLMPLSFVLSGDSNDIIFLNREEKNFFKYVDKIEDASDKSGEYSIALNMDVRFSKSKSKDDIKVAITQDEKAIKVVLTEEELKEKYPMDYFTLTKKCRERYKDFKLSSKYHSCRKKYSNDPKYAYTRYLNPEDKSSSSKVFFSEAIFSVFDKIFERK